MTPKEILIAARSVIENPENWTRGAYARTKTGRVVDHHAKDAECFCSIGAVMKVNYSRDGDVIGLLNKASPTGSIVALNDKHSHQEVIEAFDRAIESA